MHTKASLWLQSAGFVRNCKQENNLIWQGLCKTFFLNAHILLLLTQSTWPSMGVVIDPVGQRLKIAAQVYLVNLLKFMDLNFQCIARNEKRKEPRWYYLSSYISQLCGYDLNVNNIWTEFEGYFVIFFDLVSNEVSAVHLCIMFT